MGHNGYGKSTLFDFVLGEGRCLYLRYINAYKKRKQMEIMWKC
nr:hypothetical protein [Legionella cincinnatiensis]